MRRIALMTLVLLVSCGGGGSSDESTVDEHGMQDVVSQDGSGIKQEVISGSDVKVGQDTLTTDAAQEITHGQSCGNGKEICRDNCIDITHDDANCGACDNRCKSGSTCSNKVCVCPNNGTYCNETCVNTLTDNNHCGGCSNPCGSVCKNGACRGQTGDVCGEGEQCSDAIGCGGTNPDCNRGFCTSSCDRSKNNASTGINPDCPGGKATCVDIGTGNNGLCEVTCTAKGGAKPCPSGSSCFVGCGCNVWLVPGLQGTPCIRACLPAGAFCNPDVQGNCFLGLCDPTSDSSCEEDDTCMRTGIDDVGICMTGDDYSGDYASYDTGEWIDWMDSHSNLTDGQQCQYLNDCEEELLCYLAPGTSKAQCRPSCLCDDGRSCEDACTNGKTCIDLSPTVPKNVVGVCAG